jgi:V/A-type H+-transporting ATPase subunit C
MTRKGVNGLRYEPTEYLYASARIRALETRLLHTKQRGQLLSAPSVRALLDELDAKDANRTLTDGERGEAMLQERLQAAFAVVRDSVPDPTLTRFLQYPYDCHNLKVLEKCRQKGIDPTKLLIDLGSISVNTLLTVSENELLPLLPTHLARAVTESREAYAKTADPQEIDFILDRAAFADMAEAAAPFPLAREWVTARIDLSNLLFCLRLLRMQSGDLGRAVLNRAALPSGTLSAELLLECYDGGEEFLIKKAESSPYVGVFCENASLADTEKSIDNYLMSMVKKARALPFGAEIPVAFLLAAEADCKNLRILLAGKTAGLDPDTIQSRMRDCYV